MKASDLHVITCVFNPVGWRTRTEYALQFAEHMINSGVKLTFVDCALGRRPWVFDGQDDLKALMHAYVPVRCDTIAWNKESLLNIGIGRIEPDARAVAVLDADVTFRNADWAAQTVHSLEQYAVVQPWSHAIDLGPANEPMLVKGTHVQNSFGKVWREVGDSAEWWKWWDRKTAEQYGNGLGYPHCGYAWAFRHDIINRCGGLLDISGLGAADHQMAMGMVGKSELSIHGETTPEYQAAIRTWCERAYSVVKGSISYVPGTLEHHFHGAKDKRLYHERWDILIRHKFNPITDLRRNRWGVIELAGNKPAMERDFDRYFRQRDEDANILEA
jgi:hypothetical protein